MKVNYNYIVGILLIGIIVACSTKKDAFLNRTFHAKTAKYNIIFNGEEALTKGLEEIDQKKDDNFWEILPVEVLQDKDEELLPGAKKNANIQRAEDKAVKAIQKHAMNISGSEKNSQMDEAYILLGKARYYDNRLIPALEAFNYVLYKSPTSDKIYDAKVWREKINIQLDNDATAVMHLKTLLKDARIKDQELANACAILGQAYVNLGIKDTAVQVLKIARDKTKINSQKARYNYILGQLYETLSHQDSALMSFQDVIDMNRRAPRKYVIRAHGRIAHHFNPNEQDTLQFLKKYEKLFEDRENRPFLDALNYQMAQFYHKQNKLDKAEAFYKKSLKHQSTDTYQIATNYRNLADINFENSNYIAAGKYYDSTLTKLNDKTREYRSIQKKRQNLDDVIKYELISKKNDSILFVTGLAEADKEVYFQKYIDKLKAEDAKKAALEAKKLEAQNNMAANGTKAAMLSTEKTPQSNMPQLMPPGINTNDNTEDSKFYFYNSVNVNTGKIQFKKKWGSRTLKDNWRWSIASSNDSDENEEENKDDKKEITAEQKKEYTTSYYLDQLISDQKVLDSLKTERNFADYQLGVIYKEKFKEYDLAISKFEKLLKNQPEERLVLPSKYNLFKLYELLQRPEKENLKNQILTEFPESRYATILTNPEAQQDITASPETMYKNAFKSFENGAIREAYEQTNSLIEKLNGDDIIPKLELLKARIGARIFGLENYRTQLNFVALNYPNSDEGKLAEQLIQKDVPVLEKLEFNPTDATTWKIVFFKNSTAKEEIEKLQKTLEKYCSDRNSSIIKQSNDLYDIENNFIVLHGFSSKDIATSVLSLLKEYKDYKVTDAAYVISSENYKVVQIKKKWNDYLASLK